MTNTPSRVGEEPPGVKSDPTALTTDQLQREIAQLGLLLDAKFEAVFQSIQDQRELRNAQLDNLQQQMNHAERLRVELKGDNEKNIDRALMGVEKATEKLETAFTRTLGQMAESSKAESESLRRNIDSLKDLINENRSRILSFEQQKIGGKEATTERRESNAAIYAAIGIGGVVLSALMGLFGFLAARGGP